MANLPSRLPVDVFGRHLDLAPLAHAPRGLVRCIFHNDPVSSLSLDLMRGLFHCFGCGAGGGIQAFQILVGEAPTTPDTPQHEETVHEIARDMALRQPWAKPGVRARDEAADDIRRVFGIAQELRRYAATLALGDDPTWDILEAAAWWETEAHRRESL